MEAAGLRWVALFLLGFLTFSGIVDAQKSGLSLSFYQLTCPQVTTIVKKKVDEILKSNRNMAGGLQRLHFHDCWVRGCEGSILLNSTDSMTSERDSLANFGIRGIPEIDKIKDAVEKSCPGIVSCADIVALAARDATVKVGGPSWSVPLGRRDGTVSRAVEADKFLPPSVLGFTGLVKNFAAKGFHTREMVILSGGHTIGETHCGAAAPHLYNFTGVQGLTDPTLDPKFVKSLKRKCPRQGNRATVIFMDPTKNTFDDKYFKAVLENRGVFTSDAALITTAQGKRIVKAMIGKRSSFFREFGAAMEKMGRLDVLTGSAGEVRRQCQFVN